ncbi:cation-translocating P-type ATPase [Bacillus benzoevorans]|uniref:Magnesium-transporting ATPase (P-type) n=1 Tax=Bacillus benzoevorans TaxID=1456 RepID=A0A7X0HN08_9BACI|nr:cation-transporting P-type ATPase [Bacillus benzoevorans]MBB6443596.1 magnesium-transporting ATPase (P-type) [Bacillus benzoevorans]
MNERSRSSIHENGQSKMIEVDPQKISELAPSAVFSYLQTSQEGLSEAESQERLHIYGENAIKSKQSFHSIRVFSRQLFNLMAVMLWIASILAVISGNLLLSYVMWFIIIINAFFSFFQERKAYKALQSLEKMIPNQVKVYRNGEITMQHAEQLVPGDVVYLTAGDKVPADIRIVAADGLFVDNSMLTGESIPVDRDGEADHLGGKSIVYSHNILFAGTSITGGNAKGIIYAAGENTQIGNITQTTAHIIRRKSTLEFQIRKITKVLVIIALILGALAFLISNFITGVEINAAAIFAIGIIVANIPEGLMPTVSLSLAMGVQRMAKKKALVRNQSAVETLSCTSVICTDKTGTLTQNALLVKKIWTSDGMVEVSGDGYGKSGTLSGVTEINRKTLERFFTAAAICSDTVLKSDEKNQHCWKVIGDPTEAAILIASEKFNQPVAEVKDQFALAKVIPFSSSTKTMTVYAYSKNEESQQLIQFTKGDPAKVIDRCSFIFKNGRSVVLTAEEKKGIHMVHDTMANEGFRLLAVASAQGTEGAEEHFQGMTLLGLAIMYDPPKKGVQEAIADCYRAGIKVTVVTGDYSLTAAAIAKQIGIIKDHYVAITGTELEHMSGDELAEKIDTDIPVIFARTTPKDKLTIVEAYQNLGHIVASTGDGLNDVLALRKADIGISMGKNGSDAAIESSDVVLLDDNFATIVEAVKEGRSIYNNIQKFITYILASNIPEVVPFLVMGIFNIPLALTVLLVLAIDLGTDLIPAISLGEEEAEEDVLDYPPRKMYENILNKRVLIRSYGFLGLAEGVIMFVMFFIVWHDFGYSLEEVRSFTASITNGTAGEHISYVYSYAITLAFGAVIACQIGNVFECRSAHQSFLYSLRKRNHLMLWGILLEIVLFLLIAYVPFLQMLFGTKGLQIEHLLLLLLCPVALILLEEIRKRITKKMKEIKSINLQAGT